MAGENDAAGSRRRRRQAVHKGQQGAGAWHGQGACGGARPAVKEVVLQVYKQEGNAQAKHRGVGTQRCPVCFAVHLGLFVEFALLPARLRNRRQRAAC